MLEFQQHYLQLIRYILREDQKSSLNILSEMLFCLKKSKPLNADSLPMYVKIIDRTDSNKARIFTPDRSIKQRPTDGGKKGKRRHFNTRSFSKVLKEKLSCMSLCLQNSSGDEYCKLCLPIIVPQGNLTIQRN